MSLLSILASSLPWLKLEARMYLIHLELNGANAGPSRASSDLFLKEGHVAAELLHFGSHSPLVVLRYLHMLAALHSGALGLAASLLPYQWLATVV